jgi:hypothetical protein
MSGLERPTQTYTRPHPVRTRRARYSPGRGNRNHPIQRAIDDGNMPAARSLAEAESDPLLRLWFLAKCADIAADLSLARELYSRGIAAAEPSSTLPGVDSLAQAYWRAHFSRKLAFLGWQGLDVAGRDRHLHDLSVLADEHESLHYLNVDRHILEAHICEDQGRNGAAARRYKQALELAVEVGDDRRRMHCQMLLGRALYYLGDASAPEAGASLTLARREAQAIGHRTARIRADMFYADLEMADESAGRERYERLHREARDAGFKGLELSLRDRLLGFGDRTLEAREELIEEVKRCGYLRLGLLLQARSLRYIEGPNARKRGLRLLRRLVADIDSLGAEGKASVTLIVRDAVQSVVALAERLVRLHPEPDCLGDLLARLLDHCALPGRDPDWSARHREMVLQLIEALAARDAVATATEIKHRAFLQKDVYAILVKMVGEEFTARELAAKMDEPNAEGVRGGLIRLKATLEKNPGAHVLEKLRRGVRRLTDRTRLPAHETDGSASAR